MLWTPNLNAALPKATSRFFKSRRSSATNLRLNQDQNFSTGLRSGEPAHAPTTNYVFVHIPVNKVLSKMAVSRKCEANAMISVRRCSTYQIVAHTTTRHHHGTRSKCHTPWSSFGQPMENGTE